MNEFMNESDQKLHREIHKQMMAISPENIFSPRVNVFKELEKKLDLKVSGTVADIGCGNGYASIWMAKFLKPEMVFAIEASEMAVKELLPRNIVHHHVENKVKPLHASFDSLPFVNEIDFVISFGALHHSRCLLSTMMSVSKSLKQGGYLIAQEPVMPNTTSNTDYINKYNSVETMHGLRIKNGERYDCFFREAEYITAASFSGLDLIYYDDFRQTRGLTGIKVALRNLLTALGLIQDQRKYSYQKMLMKKIIVFKKSEVDYIPHLWSPLAK